MVKVPPSSSARSSLLAWARWREVGDGLFEIAEVQQLGVADHRNDQALAAAHGDADVAVVVVDDLLTLDLGVDLAAPVAALRRPPSRRNS